MKKNGYITIIFYIIILYLAAIICQFIMGDIIRVIFLMAQPVKNNRPLLTYLMKSFFYGQIICENSSFTGSRSKPQNESANVSLQLWRQTNNKNRALKKRPYDKKDGRLKRLQFTMFARITLIT